jgi:lysophospholipase L1-like esterase
MRILVFGDSIAYGCWDPEGGWVERLRRDYMMREEKDGFNDTQPLLFNLGIPGEMAEGVVKRLALETRARKWLGEELMILVAVGINDTMIYKGVEANSTELFEGELRRITAAARQFSDKVVFVGLTAVEEKVCNTKDICYQNDRIALFEQTLRRIGEEYTVPVVEVFEHFQKTDGLLADGLHPNGDGHKFIAGAVRPYIDTMLSSQ